MEDISFTQWMELSNVGYNKSIEKYIFENKEYMYGDLLNLFNKRKSKFGNN